MFLEFNTLSVVYGRPSENFLKDKVLKQSLASEKKYYPDSRGFKNTADQEKLLQDEQAATNDNLVAVDDLLDMGGSS